MRYIDTTFFKLRSDRRCGFFGELIEFFVEEIILKSVDLDLFSFFLGLIGLLQAIHKLVPSDVAFPSP
jgi:hypothetical protein